MSGSNSVNVVPDHLPRQGEDKGTGEVEEQGTTDMTTQTHMQTHTHTHTLGDAVTPTVSLSINVARFDVPFMMQTIPHMVRSCNFPFAQRTLVLDLSVRRAQRRYQGIDDAALNADLLRCCRQLIADGVMDSMVEIDFSDASRRRINTAHFGRDIGHTHNFRGAPILGYLAGIDAATSDYFLHFDSDMLVHQAPGHSWISDGIALLGSAPDVFCVSPLPGPPALDGSLRAGPGTEQVFNQPVRYTRDPRGFYGFGWFSSRKFLMDMRRYREILPLKPRVRSLKHAVSAPLRRASPVVGWEVMISDRIYELGLLRAELDSAQAWTLHTPDHGAAFIANLPEVIALVEQGWYPPTQAGDYDLRLDDWLAHIHAGSGTDAGATAAASAVVG